MLGLGKEIFQSSLLPIMEYPQGSILWVRN